MLVLSVVDKTCDYRVEYVFIPRVCFLFLLSIAVLHAHVVRAVSLAIRLLLKLGGLCTAISLISFNFRNLSLDIVDGVGAHAWGGQPICIPHGYAFPVVYVSVIVLVPGGLPVLAPIACKLVCERGCSFRVKGYVPVSYHLLLFLLPLGSSHAVLTLKAFQFINH